MLCFSLVDSHVSVFFIDSLQIRSCILGSRRRFNCGFISGNAFRVHKRRVLLALFYSVQSLNDRDLLCDMYTHHQRVCVMKVLRDVRKVTEAA